MMCESLGEEKDGWSVVICEGVCIVFCVGKRMGRGAIQCCIVADTDIDTHSQNFARKEGRKF
jgi:hypothetical protein